MNGNYFDITTFGATPVSQNSTFDNTAAIQKAIDMAQDSLFCKTIYIPASEWLVLGRLERYDNLTFVGESTVKDYWSGSNYGDVFKNGGSVLKGDYTKELFDAADQGWHFTLRNLSFTGFTRLFVPCSPRTANITECSFKNMRVLDAPSNTTDQYHNFHFWRCAFTLYNQSPNAVNIVAFSGRMIDCEFSFNIFVASKGFDLVQARASRIFNNRFEWIDREAAISLYGCDNNMIQSNWFDRVSGVGIQLKQLNKDISVVDNTFSRCGSLLTSGGSKMNLSESYEGYIQIYGDQQGNMQIDNNHFIKGTVSDMAGSPISPKHVICLEGIGSTRRFSFRGNRYADGNACVGSIIYSASPWISSVTSIDTDAFYDNLDDTVVDLAKYSGNRIVANNNKDVTVDEIPENLTVNNTFDATITLTDGPQAGVVFGGKVNGIRRFGKLEQLAENLLPSESANGTMTGNKITYTVPVSVALRGAPIYLAANYRTYNSPDGTVEVTDSMGTVLGTLKALTLSGAQQMMYVDRFIIPETFTGTSIKINFYAAKSTVLSPNDIVIVDAFCATYGDYITRGTIDVNNV
ncbi:Pectate lyase superfamily protein [Paenibacillus sp. UNC496MF]|uniref:glycosyl hydrolase family 28-related protein n=1 Tax=Paenibacillus sp. UNC496MF TaxID=1502753 RepID=UPI0008E23595|nr:glycosyl hydrolase family 28-related protein [Paenibacillus sp. UNC496MF]SFJ62713.1 Pectate lyase superfamily protein [Paenibacillus sp. UNC496MF]